MILTLTSGNMAQILKDRTKGSCGGFKDDAAKCLFEFVYLFCAYSIRRFLSRSNELRGSPRLFRTAPDNYDAVNGESLIEKNSQPPLFKSPQTALWRSHREFEKQRKHPFQKNSAERCRVHSENRTPQHSNIAIRFKFSLAGGLISNSTDLPCVLGVKLVIWFDMTRFHRYEKGNLERDKCLR